MARLIFSITEGEQAEVPLTGSITLGRDDDNDVVLDDDHVSRHHAEIICHADGRVEVRDLGSKAGTFVNGRRVRSLILGQGDKLAFGPVTGVVDLESMAAGEGAGSVASPQPPADEALARRHAEVQEAVAKLTAEREAIQRDIASLDAARQEQAKAAAKKFDMLAHEQRGAEEALLLARDELRARTDELNVVTLRLEEARARLAELEARCETLASVEERLAAAQEQLAGLERRHAGAEAVVLQDEQLLAARNAAREQAEAAEAAARERSAALEAREKETRAELEALQARLAASRSELAGVESRLGPLRDWKDAMEERLARLGAVAKDSADESRLCHEIEEAHASLQGLLGSAGLETEGASSAEVSRVGIREGRLMKSERIRRAGIR